MLTRPQRRLRQHRLALLVAVILIALAGCGSTVQPQQLVTAGTTNGGAEAGLTAPTSAAAAGTTPSNDGGTSPDGAAALPGTPGADDGNGSPAGGVVANSPGAGPPDSVRVTTPLRIGLSYINNQQASAALGTQDPRTNSVKTVVEAFVRAINAAGGLAGRKLETVEYEWHSGDGSWNTAAESACAKFTQDNHVSVVLDQAFGTVGGFRDCLQQAGVFDITNQTVGDDVSSRDAPLYAGVGDLTIDRGYGAVLRNEARAGYLTRKDQLGIIVEGCPENERAYSRTLAPLVKSLGLAAPKTYSFSCVDSTAAGASQGQAAISNAILRFRQPPAVDRVMFVSADEAAALLLFGADASSQDYHPGYLLSSNAQAHLAVESGSGFTPDQLPQIHGVGNMPTVDVNTSSRTTVDKRCLALLKTASVVPANYDDTGQALFSCGPFLLLEALLRGTGGDASAAALARALGTLGTSFAGPGVLEGATHYAGTQRDGGDLVQTFAYTASCGCIRYTGRPAPAD